MIKDSLETEYDATRGKLYELMRMGLDDIPGMTEREKMVLVTRYRGGQNTLETTGKVFGVTRERIRQIEAKALEKIKEHYHD